VVRGKNRGKVARALLGSEMYRPLGKARESSSLRVTTEKGTKKRNYCKVKKTCQGEEKAADIPRAKSSKFRNEVRVHDHFLNTTKRKGRGG